jgi:hypothetical protein
MEMFKISLLNILSCIIQLRQFTSKAIQETKVKD